MAETFGTIKAKVADWLVRPDLADSSVLGDFVNVAMRKIEQEYDLRGMLKRLVYLVDAGTYLYEAPTDYKHLANAWFIDSQGKRYALDKDSERHARMLSPNPTTDVLDVPKRIAYVRNVAGEYLFQLTPTPSVDGSIELSYYGYTSPMSADSDENYLLSGPWHLLLDGAMAEAKHYLEDSTGMKYWTDKRNTDAMSFLASEKREEQTGSFQHMGSPYLRGANRR